jgi:hypothetical protein
MDFLAQILLEVVAYGVGRIFVAIFLPWYRVEPVARDDPGEVRGWRTQGISHVDGGKRVMRAETAELIGIVVVIAAAAVIAIAVSS